MSYYKRLAKLISAMRIPRCSWRSILRAVKGLKWSDVKRWSGPAIALLVALIILWNLGGKARREVWAYYTDGEDIRIGAQENKARSVLWEPPSPTILPKGEEKEKLKEGPSGNFEAAFSADGRQMALVLEREKGSDIFISSWDGRVWSVPEPITNINTDSNERGPAFSASGNYLYFSSDRKGGQGGYDIYAALWNGTQWATVKGLSSSINGPDNETGPAPSSDDSVLYFSSDRNGTEDQDIYAAVREQGSAKAPEPAMLQFTDSVPVNDLNSRSNDVQAALTKKGSHVFLSSDREDDSVFGVYMSRVIGDEVQSPERVDLYIKEDNVTDPAVRMDGFDLLFSTDYGSSEADEESDYRLYKSTTREVFGYRDSSRWEEYKNALGKLKWWLIAALLALLALIYLLETWQDITSLLHKCIAASMALHLLLLLLATAWFITQEFEQQSENLSSEIAISLDALSQEELAMESAPEEAEISDPSTQISIEKAESDFNIPELKPQELVENIPEAESQFQESLDIEIQTSQAETQEDSMAQKVNESSLIAELSEPVLPEIEEALLEEDPNRTTQDKKAAESNNVFEPEIESTELSKAEMDAVSDSAVESETGSESVASGSLVAEATQAESQLTESGGASQEAAQTPELASGSLPELALVEPGAPQLEEVTGDPGAQQADPSKDTFEPGGGVASLETVQEEGGAGSDSAVESETGSESVASGSLVVEATQAESQLTESGGASQEAAQTPELASGSLPELALVEPGAPQLEEVTGDPGAQQADPSKDTFEPGGGVASLETVQEEGGAGSDSAVESETGSESVASGSLVAEATQAESQLTESGGASQEAAQTPELASGSLPELALVEPGAPQLEEVTGDPGAQQADPSKDTFEPGGGVASLETVQEEGGAGSDSAVESETGSESVASGSLVAEATQAESQLTESGGASQEAAQTPELASGKLPLYAISAPLLPDSLESDRKVLNGGGLTDLIKKHRGKPSLDTIKQMGGSDGTEKAIVAGIEWLSKNQEKDGRWDTKKFNAEANYDVGGTGLALLCYFGWGARHDRPGKYQNNVKKALSWLIKQQNKDGNLAVSGKMYSHAIGTIALCEGYGITKDSEIKIAAQKAIGYTISSQHPQLGGWRYRPGQESDTSVTGWQFMALHSARMAGINVPEQPFELARRWLDFAGGGKHGGLYGYKGPSEISRAMVATGMFCRQLDLVPPTDPRMIESAQLLKNNPLRPINPDLYYIYYATLALYQHQGPIWQDWNNKLKETLPKIQNKTGKNAGSWDLSRLMTKGGGRVASTTLAVLSLEVYYRILPMYGFRGTDVPEIKLKEGQ